MAYLVIMYLMASRTLGCSGLLNFEEWRTSLAMDNEVRVTSGLIIQDSTDEVYKQPIPNDESTTYFPILPCDFIDRNCTELVDHSFINTIVIIMNFESSKSVQELVLHQSEENMSSNCWLILGSEHKLALELHDILGPLKSQLAQSLAINSQVYVVSYLSDKAYHVIEVYAIGNHVVMAELDWKHSIPFIWERRSNLYNHTMRVGVVPSIHKKDPGSQIPCLESMEAGSSIYIEYLSKILNFFPYCTSYVQWGVRDKSGEWKGIVRGLADKTIDIGTYLTENKDRSEIIDFANMGVPEKVMLVYKRPKMSFHMSAMLDTISLNYWIAMGAGTVIIFFILVISITITNKKLNFDVRSPMSFVFLSSFSLDPTPAIQLSMSELWSYRIILLTAMWLGWMNFEILAANMTSSFMTVTETIPFQTIDDLLNDDVNVQLRHGSYIYAMFGDPKSSEKFQLFYNKKIKGNPSTDINKITYDQRISQLRASEEKLVYILLIDVSLKQTYLRQHWIKILPLSAQYLKTGLAWQKDWTFGKLFNYQITHLGNIEEAIKKTLDQSEPDLIQEDDEFGSKLRPVSLNHVILFLSVLLIGIGLASAFLTFEVLHRTITS